MAGNWPNASAPSHVFQRGDVEILSFDTEETYDRLEELYRKTKETQPPPGEMTPLYYRSKLDGSVQPYSVRLPRGYDKERKYPLVLQLHGTNFKEVLTGSRTRSTQGMGGPQWIQPDLPVIYAHPFGSPTIFLHRHGRGGYPGRYRRDEAALPRRPRPRLHHGAFDGGLRVVHRRASLPGPLRRNLGGRCGDVGRDCPRCPTGWRRRWRSRRSRSCIPTRATWTSSSRTPARASSARSTEFADGIVAQGGFATTEVFPRMPHSFGMQYPYANFVTEVTGHPIKRKPPAVKYYTNTLRYNGAYWVTIDRLTRHNADALVEAECEENTVRVTTTNIDALTLRLNDAPVPKGKPMTLVVDGREVIKGELPETVHLSKQSGAVGAGRVESRRVAREAAWACRDPSATHSIRDSWRSTARPIAIWRSPSWTPSAIRPARSISTAIFP